MEDGAVTLNELKEIVEQLEENQILEVYFYDSE